MAVVCVFVFSEREKERDEERGRERQRQRETRMEGEKEAEGERESERARDRERGRNGEREREREREKERGGREGGRGLLGLNCKVALQNLVELLAHGGFLVDYFVDLRYDGSKERCSAEKEEDAEDLPRRRRTEVGIAGEEWFGAAHPLVRV